MAETAHLPEDDLPMGRVYALVIVCHALVITSLWWFGRFFTR